MLTRTKKKKKRMTTNVAPTTPRVTSYRFIVPPQLADERTHNEFIVLVHGINGSMQTWLPEVVVNLAKACSMPCLIYDVAGHGENEELLASSTTTLTKEGEHLEQALRPVRLAKDLKELIDVTLGLWSSKLHLHLFGQSFGSRTVLTFAEYFPERVASLSLGDIGVCPCPRRTLEGCRELVAKASAKHRDVWPDEESLRAYLSEENLSEGGDTFDRKFVVVEPENIYDPESKFTSFKKVGKRQTRQALTVSGRGKCSPAFCSNTLNTADNI